MGRVPVFLRSQVIKMGCVQHFSDPRSPKWVVFQYFSDPRSPKWVVFQYFSDPRSPKRVVFQYFSVPRSSNWFVFQYFSVHRSPNWFVFQYFSDPRSPEWIVFQDFCGGLSASIFSIGLSACFNCFFGRMFYRLPCTFPKADDPTHPGQRPGKLRRMHIHMTRHAHI